ncbi:MAG: hypothetical protein ACE5JX_21705 [Acidobacteriota bacterium]
MSSELEQHRGLGRVYVVGDIPPELDIRIEDLSNVTGGLEGCVFRLGRLRSAYDLDSLRDERTVRGLFIRQVEAADLSPIERRKILLTGLRALDGRDDLEVIIHEV